MQLEKERLIEKMNSVMNQNLVGKVFINTLVILLLPFVPSAQTELYSFTGSGFAETCDVSIAPNGNVWVADCNQGLSEKFTSSGTSLGNIATGAVSGLSVRGGNFQLYKVANDSVRIYESDGAFIESRDATGIAVEHINNTYYVLDGGTVKIYASSGAFAGTGGSFSAAVSIHYSVSNNQFVFADNGADEVVVMDGGLSSVLVTLPLLDPNGAAMLSDGRIVVAHSDSISFYQDDGAGYFLAQSSNMGGSLSSPGRMNVNSSDEIYLVNEGANEIMVILPPPPVALPIVLSKFEARIVNNHTYLRWRSESEINAEGFEVQHSLDGRNFENVGFVKSEGSASNYEFKHVPDPGVNYYRLNQIDLDGFQEFSKIVQVVAEDSKEIKIYPNPSTGT